MIQIYGIKNCGSVRKAIAFFNKLNLEYCLFDFKKDTCNSDKISYWIEQKGIDVVLNKKGATYRKLGLSKLNLNEADLLQKMSENNLLIKRPIIEYKDDIIIGFDEDIYNNKFKK